MQTIHKLCMNATYCKCLCLSGAADCAGGDGVVTVCGCLSVSIQFTLIHPNTETAEMEVRGRSTAGLKMADAADISYVYACRINKYNYVRK